MTYSNRSYIIAFATFPCSSIIRIVTSTLYTNESSNIRLTTALNNMASFARSLRIARTALPRPTSSFASLTSIRHVSKTSILANPSDPRHGKNMRGEEAEGVGDPAKFQNPNKVTEGDDGHSSIPGETHAKDGGADSYVPLVSSHAVFVRASWTNKIFQAAQKLVPESVERALPNAIHNTGSKPASSSLSSTNKDLNESVEAHAEGVKQEASSKASSWGIGETHARDGGKDSIVPLPIQKIVPEAVERILPDFIHNTSDSAKTTGLGETHAAKGGEDSVVPKAAQKAVPETVERALPNKVHNTKD